MARRSSGKSVEREVDALLAAPESVLRSEAERRKYAARKAREQAEEEQLRASKSKERPSVEDLLADLVRCAEDKATNPYWRFKTLSRKRYRLFGHYPLEFVLREFGTFEHAKQVAHLEDKPGTRLKMFARAEASKREQVSRYLTRYVLPYVRLTDPVKRAEAGVRLVVSISDTHATFLDPFTWHAFLCTIAELFPDVVYLNGDIMEGSEISRHPKIPGWTVPLQLELDFAREMFRQIREVGGSRPRVIWGAGNHGLDRLASYLTHVAPAFAGLRTLRFDKLVGLDDLKVELAQGGTIASPAGTEDDAPGRLLFGCYRVHHGTKLGASPGLEELRAAGRSGQSGHVHRASLVYGATEANRGLSWMTTPMGCTDRAGRAYMKGPCTGWQRGFGVAFVGPRGEVRQYPVVTDDGFAVVEGRVFERPAGLGEMDPSKLWLPDLPLPSTRSLFAGGARGHRRRTAGKGRQSRAGADVQPAGVSSRNGRGGKNGRRKAA